MSKIYFLKEKFVTHLKNQTKGLKHTKIITLFPLYMQDEEFLSSWLDFLALIKLKIQCNKFSTYLQK